MKIAGKLAVAALLTALSDASAQAPAADRACWVRGNRAAAATRPSPLDSSMVSLGGREVKVCYSAPRVNGREVLGGLIPYDTEWRLGANEATAIYMPARGTIAGVAVEPGWYSLYTVAGKTEWKVGVNTVVQRWGIPVDAAVKAKDVGVGTVKPETADAAQESMKLQLTARGNDAADLVLHWDRVRVRIPVTLAR